MTQCSIPDCGKRVLARGWCGAHYRRWWIHGGPLEGGTVPGAPLKFYREVVLAYDGAECLKWPFGASDDGYARMWLNSRTQIVSRRLCEDVNGPPPTPEHEAAHSCGKGKQGCVTKLHLSWKTSAENKADCVIHGTSNRGERCGSAKLKEADVHLIRSTDRSVPRSAIASRFGISRQTVSDIRAGRRWRWLAADKRFVDALKAAPAALAAE